MILRAHTLRAPAKHFPPSSALAFLRPSPAPHCARQRLRLLAAQSLARRYSTFTEGLVQFACELLAAGGTGSIVGEGGFDDYGQGERRGEGAAAAVLFGVVATVVCLCFVCCEELTEA